jgi:hypothetical protein
MSWHEERERLLTDTIAFVQQALGDGLVLAVKARVPLSPEIEAAARYLRRYHTDPKPKQIADLRNELNCASAAFANLHRALRFDRPGNYQTANEHAKSESARPY